MKTENHQETHFTRMAELASQLRAISAEMLEHEYSYESFGSWWVAVRCCGTVFRICFDGKEQLLYFERSESKKPPYEWRHALADQSGVSGEAAVSDLVQFIRRLANKPLQPTSGGPVRAE